MYKLVVPFLLVCFIVGTSFSEGTETGKSSPRANTWGVCFDEGLGARCWITDDIPIYASVFLWSVGADSVLHQPLNTFSLKLGGGYKFFQLGRLALPAVLEVMVNMDQYEIPPLAGDNNYKRCNLWSVAFRIGAAPEFFITDHFSIGYKFGIEFGHIGTEYEANLDNSDTESSESDHNYFGFFGFGAENPGSKMRFLESILLTIYF